MQHGQAKPLPRRREGAAARLGLRAPAPLLLVALLGCTAPSAPDWAAQRQQMVERQIAARGVRDARVLAAMGRVPRHRFVPDAVRRQAYQDRPLPIGLGQTISQPYVVAAMTEALAPQPGDRVLEVGTGSGYQAAVLSLLVAEVYSIEIRPELAERARATLAALGYENVSVVTGDGYRGLPERAPFDGILVTAAPEEIPEALVAQLALGGRMVLPVGRELQQLVLVERDAAGVHTRHLFPVQFVPMVRQ